MNKKLYVVATPIGNVEEITERALKTIEKNNIFFCEDTRVARKLFGILRIDMKNKKFIALNSFNEKKVISTIDFDKADYCLISDAGYPLINDPGYLLINHFIDNNWTIEVVNGPCSLIHALVVSGYKTQDFLFHGFLSNNKADKKKELFNLSNEKRTIILFESVHRIKETLICIQEIFPKSIELCVCRELTKINESIYRGKINEIIPQIIEKGEFVIVINNNEQKEKEIDMNCYLNELEVLIKKGEKEKVACKMISYKHAISSKVLYDFWQSRKNNV